MIVTFILKDLSEVFYAGNGGAIVGLLNQTDKDKFEYLSKAAREKALKISIRVGHCDAFRDRVELNQITRNGNARYAFKLEPRRGYRLATFDVTN